MLALTQEEAAAKLGKSRRAIQAYERPDPKTGRTAKVDLCTRIVMDMLNRGTPLPTPWSE